MLQQRLRGVGIEVETEIEADRQLIDTSFQIVSGTGIEDMED